MTRLLLRWILMTLSVIAAAMISHALHLGFEVNVHSVPSFIELMVGVLVLSFLNATLGRILKFLTLPLSCITFGLFSLVINAIVLMLAASLKLGFQITGQGAGAFIAAFVASLLIAFINGVLGVFIIPDDKED